MPVLLVTTMSVAAIATTYLTMVTADVNEARSREAATRAAQLAMANLEIARNIVNAAPYTSAGNTALLAAMAQVDAQGRHLLPGTPLDIEVEELGEDWFLLRTYGEYQGVRKIAQATVRMRSPVTGYNYFVAEQKLGISGEPRGLIHSNDSIDFYFPGGIYQDAVTAVNGFGYRAGATEENTRLLGANNATTTRRDILNGTSIADVAARADTLRIDDNLIAEVSFLGASTKVDLFRPASTERIPYQATEDVFSHYETWTENVRTPVYRTETYAVTVPVYERQPVTTTERVPVYADRTVTVIERVPVYGTRTVMVTVTRRRWIELAPGGSSSGGDVSGGGSAQGFWQNYDVQEPRQEQYVIRHDERQVTRTEQYVVRYEERQVTRTARVQVGTRQEQRTRQVIDRHEMVATTRQRPIYTQQTVTRYREVVIPEQFVETRTVPSQGILWFAGPLRKLQGTVTGRMTVVTNASARITGSIQYVDAQGNTRMKNGLDASQPYEPNPDYTGSSVLAIMARDDVRYAVDAPPSIEINGALITTEGTVAFDGLEVAADGETVTHTIAPGRTATEYQKESIRRLGGIVSRERPVATYIDGNNNLVAGFRTGRSTMDRTMQFQNGGGIAPPGVLTEDRPVWGVTMIERMLDGDAVRGGS